MRSSTGAAPLFAGKPSRNVYLHSSEEVFEGTRIPVSAVLGYLDAGIGAREIVRRLPDLTLEDVREPHGASVRLLDG